MVRPLLIALSLSATAAQACPPVNQHPSAVAEREAAWRRCVEGSAGIVYGVVDRRVVWGRGGTLRILHVYRGDFRVGQRLHVLYAPPQIPGDCYVYSPPGSIFYRRGAYGVAFIGAPDANRRHGFGGLIGGNGAAQLIREATIESARTPGEVQR